MTTAVVVLLDGLAYGMVLFIISVGLTVTMGLMRVVNLAHGGFAMIGGYAAAALVGGGIDFALAVAAAALLAGTLGGIAEATLFRPLYRKGELAQVLLTFGLTLVMVAVLTAIFGADIKPLPLPDFLAGAVDLGTRPYPAYRLFLIVVGAILALALWIGIDRSLAGARLRAAVDNARMARAVGINVDRLFTIVFALGSALAGLGGAIGAGLLPIEPFYALRYLVIFLIVVTVGGLGSISGSFLAALALGVIDSTGKFLLPTVAPFILPALVILLLLLRPQGIIAPRATA